MKLQNQLNHCTLSEANQWWPGAGRYLGGNGNAIDLDHDTLAYVFIKTLHTILHELCLNKAAVNKKMLARH